MIKVREKPENGACSDDDLDLIVQAANGDMRRAILLMQVALITGKCQDLLAVSQSETTTIAGAAIAALKEGDAPGAGRRLESLMIDYGLSGNEVIAEIRTILKREYNHPRLAIVLADAEHRMRHANNEFVQVASLTAGMREIFL
jgi:replication factor C small subunit